MRYWLETDRRGQVRRVHQTTNPKRPGEPRNKPHRDTYNSWAVLYRAANGHVELHATGSWGPSPALDARIRLDGTYDQLDDAERAAYDRHVARSLKSNTRGWEDWHADLAYVRSHLAEHGTLPDPAQLAQVRGARLYEADAVAAVAAVTAGLGGNHAAAPAEPAARPPGPAAENVLPAPPPHHPEPAEYASGRRRVGKRQLPRLTRQRGRARCRAGAARTRRPGTARRRAAPARRRTRPGRRHRQDGWDADGYRARPGPYRRAARRHQRHHGRAGGWTRQRFPPTSPPTPDTRSCRPGACSTWPGANPQNRRR